MHQFILQFLVILTSLASQTNAKQKQALALLSPIGSIRVHLDYVTPPNSFRLQYIAEKDQLAYWNDNDFSIIYFSLKTGKPVKKTFIEREGPNPNYSNNYLYVDDQTIYTNDVIGAIRQIDINGKSIKKHKNSDPSKINKLPDPMVWTGSPMTYHNSKLYFQVTIGGVFTQPTMAVLNLKTDQIDYFSGYPDFYKEAYWRGGFENIFYTFNPDKELFVFSYAADKNLTSISVKDLNGTNSHYASSPTYGNLKAPRKSMQSPGRKHDEMKFMTQPSFHMIHYDPYRKLYYRFAQDPISENDYYSKDSERSETKAPRIIILNEHLEVIGEKELPRFKYDINMSFVSPKGLCIKLKNNEAEDFIDFEVLLWQKE